jgi:hypothetical protein
MTSPCVSSCPSFTTHSAAVRKVQGFRSARGVRTIWRGLRHVTSPLRGVPSVLAAKNDETEDDEVDDDDDDDDDDDE